ncbi:bifunctional hydroxymethylpyrimidine kinase/phosphomethylpyrimidine kinase [Brachybacterium sp. DNPG3]
MFSTSAPALPITKPDEGLRPPTALTIAGSDSGGGAGIQADLKTFSALGVYGTSALTGLTAQNTQGVQGILPVPVDFVIAQLMSVVDDIPIDATKLGMLTSAEIVEALAERIGGRRDDFGLIVLDPVMIATSGDALLPESASAALRDRLLPLADVLTPNLPEAAALLDEEVAVDLAGMQAQAERLRALGPRTVVLKGGHRDGVALGGAADGAVDGAAEDAADGDDEVVDVVAHEGGVELLRAPRVRTRSTHGTGCTLSSAIAAAHARRGRRELDLGAVRAARDFLQRALVGARDWELSRTPSSGRGPVDHLVDW